jgi:hypothetical protein
MGSKVIRNVTKILKATSGRLFGRVTSGTGRAEELTPGDVRTLLSVSTTAEIAAAYQPIGSYAASVHTHSIADVTGLQTAIDGKQDTLVSGTNIKTVNSTSLLGSGDIVVSASPAGSTGQVQFNNAGSFGGAAAVVYAATGTHLAVTAQGSTIVPGCFQGAASQSANLTEWKNSAGTNLLRVSSSGSIQFGTQPNSITSSGGEISIRSDNGVGNNATFTFGATGGLVLLGAVVMGGSINVLSRSGAVVTVANNTGEIRIAPNGTSQLTVDLDATAGNTRLLLWDVSKGSLQRVSIGASDSGGTGFKVLRVPN